MKTSTVSSRLVSCMIASLILQACCPHCPDSLLWAVGFCCSSRFHGCLHSFHPMEVNRCSVEGSKITPGTHALDECSFLCSKPCKYLVNRLGGDACFEVKRCEHTQPALCVARLQRRRDGRGRAGRDLRVQREWRRSHAGERDTVHFHNTSCKTASGCTFIQQVFMEGGFVLVPVPGTLITQIHCLEPAESWQQTELKSSDSNKGQRMTMKVWAP